MPRKKAEKVVAESDSKTERKIKCPVSHKEFLQNAEDLPVIIGKGHGMLAVPRKFKTGSVGWISSGKAMVAVGEVPVPVQITITMTVINSKGKGT